MAIAGAATTRAPAMAAAAVIGMRLMSLLGIDQVPAGHPRLHVGLDVAVVEPPAGVVFTPARGHRGLGPEQLVVHEAPVGSAPAMAVDVEGVQHRVAAEDVEGHVLTDLGADGRRVARRHAAVDALEVAPRSGDLL